MSKSIRIQTQGAPSAIGPYSQAVARDGWVYLSGQVALSPTTGEMMNGSLKDEVIQVMSNLRAVLREAGSSLDDVVKCTVYMTDLEDFAEFNGIYGTYFSRVPPARATVQVSQLPKGARIEIDAIGRITS